METYLQDEWDGALSEEQALALRTHLEACEPCRRAAAATRAVFEHAAAMPVYRAHPGFDAAVIAAATSPPVRSELHRRWPYFLAGVAASLLFALAFGWIVGLTPEVQASTVLDEAIRSHCEAVLDFAQSVTLLPATKPDLEVELVRRDLEDSHLLGRTKELRSLVLACRSDDRKPVLNLLDESERMLCQVNDVVRSRTPPKDAIVRVRQITASLSTRLPIVVHARVETSDRSDQNEPKPLQEFGKARRAYFRGDLSRALPGFQRFRVSTENDTDLQPFRGVAVFSLEQCEKRLGLDLTIDAPMHLGPPPGGSGQVMLKVEGSGDFVLQPPQVDRFFVILDQEGVKLDPDKRRIIEGALRKLVVVKPDR